MSHYTMDDFLLESNFLFGCHAIAFGSVALGLINLLLAAGIYWFEGYNWEHPFKKWRK